MTKTEMKDVAINVGSKMTLEIKEMRGSSTAYSRKDGFSEVSSNTRTHFHWRLHGTASKISIEDVQAGDSDLTKQEVYKVDICSDGYAIGFFCGFKSREEAIRNALAFANRNNIDVDGYKPE